MGLSWTAFPWYSFAAERQNCQEIFAKKVAGMILMFIVVLQVMVKAVSKLSVFLVNSILLKQIFSVQILTLYVLMA